MRDRSSAAPDPRAEAAVTTSSDKSALLGTPLAAIVEMLPDAVLLCDRQGRIVRASAEARRLFASDAVSNLLALPLDQQVRLLAPRDQAGQPLPLERWIVARVLRGETVTVTAADLALIRITHPDGRERVLSATGAPIRSAAGTITGAVVIARDVTAQVGWDEERTEKALQLDAVLDAIADAVFVYDGQGDILRINDAARELLALGTRPDYTALPLDERRRLLAPRSPDGQMLPEPPIPVTQALHGQTLTGETALDLVLRRMDGNLIDVNLTAAPIRDPITGAITGAVAILRDTSERRRLEREAGAGAREFEAIVAAIADAVYVYDAGGALRHANAAAQSLDARLRDPRYREHSFDERLGSADVRDGQGRPLPPDKSPAARVLAGEVLTGSQSVDTWVRMPDGRDVLLNTTGAPVRDPATGEIVEGVIVSRDVTERRQLERRTQQTLEALLEIADLFVAPVAPSDGDDQNSPAAIVGARIAELTARVLGCRRVALLAAGERSGPIRPLAAFGLSPQEERRWLTGDSDGGYLRQTLPAQIATRLTAGETLVHDYSQPPLSGPPNPDGIRTALLAPLRVGAELVGMLNLDFGPVAHSYSDDEIRLAAAVAQLAALIVERDRLLREREAARASALALREANRRMDEFLGVAGHELRTPLTVVKADTQVLARLVRPPADPDGGESAVPIEPGERALRARLLLLTERTGRQIDRLERLVNDLLDISRIKAGKLDLRLEPADLLAVVSEAVESQRHAAPGRRIRLRLPRRKRLIARMDADRIGQVVINLLTNALKFSPHGRSVAVELAVEGHAARITVRDRGPGIPPQEQPRVWELFHQAADVAVQEGSGVGLGLGLHLARTIVERHGGAVGLDSVPGDGAAFWFTLPLSDQSH